MFVWDKAKNVANIAKHGLAFDQIHGFDWENPVLIDRTRRADGEQRYAAIGFFKKKLHTVIFTSRGDDVRIISFRRSNQKEKNTYGQK